MKRTILHRFENTEDGFEVHVTDHQKGYGVTIYDTDSESYFSSIQIFPSERWAVEFAESIAGGYVYNHAEILKEGSNDLL